jgi:hypothetical protein
MHTERVGLALMLRTRIQGGALFESVRDTCYPDWGFHGFPQLPQANAGILPLLGPPASFQIISNQSYISFTVRCYVVQLLKASQNSLSQKVNTFLILLPYQYNNIETHDSLFTQLAICSLLNNAVSNSHHIASNYLVTVNNELKRMWKEALMALFKV